MGTLDYTVVFGDTVYPQGSDVPDDVVAKIENPATSGAPVVEDSKPKAGDKKDVWLMYAIDRGVAVDDGATKADIVAAVDAYEAGDEPAADAPAE